MLFKTVGQAYVFMAAVYAGLAMGLCYDIFKIIRMIFRQALAMTLLCDTLFSVSATAIAAWCILQSNDGDIGTFIFLGFIAGFFLFKMTLSKLVFGLIKQAKLFFTKRQSSQSRKKLPDEESYNRRSHEGA